MTDGVSISEFAREIGISRTMVQKLLKSGTLPQYKNGTIPLEAGLNAYEVYKAAPKSKGGRPAKTAKEAKAKKNDSPPIQTAPPEIQQENIKIDDVPQVTSSRAKEAVNINTALNKAKLAEKTYQARLRELDFKFRSGELVEKAAVATEAQWLAEQVKAKLMAIPPRISSMCEGRIAREIEEIISDSINNALKELQKCKYTGEQE